MQEKYMDPQTQYWMNEGVKTGAFLLIIPGATLFGGALGWLEGFPVQYGLMGLGAGMVLWGTIVVFRKRESLPAPGIKS